MTSRNAWFWYIVLRLLFFAVPFGLMLWLLNSIGWSYWPMAITSTVVAALVSVSLSIIFLKDQRDTASVSIYEWRNKERTADDIVEDEAVDAARAESEQQHRDAE